MSHRSLLAILAIASAAAPASAQDDGCAPGAESRFVLERTAAAPALGEWTDQLLSVPKYVPQPLETLRRVDVQLCVVQTGVARYENMGDGRCAATWDLDSTFSGGPLDAASPIAPFALQFAQSGGRALTSFDGAIDYGGSSGAIDLVTPMQQCPVWTFTGADAQWFVGAPGDLVELQHSLSAAFLIQGCGELRTHPVANTQVTLRVTYSVCVSADCNGNGIADEVDIAQGISTDADNNGVPDECEAVICYSVNRFLLNREMGEIDAGGSLGAGMMFDPTMHGFHLEVRDEDGGAKRSFDVPLGGMVLYDDPSGCIWEYQSPLDGGPNWRFTYYQDSCRWTFALSGGVPLGSLQGPNFSVLVQTQFVGTGVESFLTAPMASWSYFARAMPYYCCGAGPD